MKKIKWFFWIVTNYGTPIFSTMADTRKESIARYDSTAGGNSCLAGLLSGRLKVEKFIFQKKPTE
jgi:hypothetical protein